jgi:hypothetical protein
MENLREHGHPTCQLAGEEMTTLTSNGLLLKSTDPEDIEVGYAAYARQSSPGVWMSHITITPHFFQQQPGFQSVTHRQGEVMAHEIVGHLINGWVNEIDGPGDDWACWCNEEPNIECQEWNPGQDPV